MASATLYHTSVNTSDVSLDAPTLPPYTEHATPITTSGGVGRESRGENGYGIELSDLSRIYPTRATRTTTTSRSPFITINDNSNNCHNTFTPSRHLQIQTAGKPLSLLPTPQRPDPIPVYALSPAPGRRGGGGVEVVHTLPTNEQQQQRPLYLSIRPDAGSGSCALVYGDDYLNNSGSERESGTLTTTTYRFGPGRPPVVVLGRSKNQQEQETESESESEISFSILGRGIFSRAITFDVPGLGRFGWRYGKKSERAAAGADSLLICEFFFPSGDSESAGQHEGGKCEVESESDSDSDSDSESASETETEITARATGTVIGSGNGNANGSGSGSVRHRHGDNPSRSSAKPGFQHTSRSTPGCGRSRSRSHRRSIAKARRESNDKEDRFVIAHLVRNAEFRSPGSSRSSAGNGGRLMLDLTTTTLFESEKVREKVEWLIVTTAVCMLKREVDRRRAQQAVAIGAIVS